MPRISRIDNNLAPPLGAILRDKQNNGTMHFTVSDVFPAGAYHGMILDWQDDGKRRGQAFTCRDWSQRWEVISVPEAK